MATVSQEQLVQRTKTAIVAITYDGQDNSPGETLWMTTTTAPYTIVTTKAVAANQLDRQVMEDRIVAAGVAQYGAINLYTTEGIGYNGLAQPLVVVGDGSEVNSQVINTTETVDMDPFFIGGYEPLVYTIGAGTFDNGVPTMIGSVFQFVANGVAGSDSVPVIATDRGGTAKTVTMVVTVTAS